MVIGVILVVIGLVFIAYGFTQFIKCIYIIAKHILASDKSYKKELKKIEGYDKFEKNLEKILKD